jgi:hypothetical protein
VYSDRVKNNDGTASSKDDKRNVDNINELEESDCTASSHLSESEPDLLVARLADFEGENFVPLFEEDIEQINRIVPLTEEERARIREEVPGEEGELGETKRRQTLTAILGAERTDQYYQIRETAWRQWKEDSILKEVYFHSRQLSLSEDQERLFSDALRKFNAERDRAEREAFLMPMPLTEGGSTSEPLPSDVFQKRMNEELQKFLTSEQYSNYLSRQMNAPGRVLGFDK